MTRSHHHHRFLERLLRRHRLQSGHSKVRAFWDEELAKATAASHTGGPFTIKGVYKGQFYRIRVPAAPEPRPPRLFPNLPKLPQTHLAKPKTFTKLPPPSSTTTPPAAAATTTTTTTTSTPTSPSAASPSASTPPATTTAAPSATSATGSTSSAPTTAAVSSTSASTVEATAPLMSHATPATTTTTLASSTTATTTTTTASPPVRWWAYLVDFAARLYEWWLDNWAVLVLNIGSICALVGFTRSDVIELRALNATGSLAALIYHNSLSPRRVAPMAWSFIFAAVNSWKIYQVIAEREGTVNMTQAQEQVYSKFFMPHGVTPKQFEHIYQQAEIVHVKKGDIVVQERQAMTHVCLVTQGETRAQALGRRLTAASFNAAAGVEDDAAATEDRLSWTSGAWIGEMAFLQAYWNTQQQQQQQQQTTSSTATSSSGSNGTASSSISAASTTLPSTERQPDSTNPLSLGPSPVTAASTTPAAVAATYQQQQQQQPLPSSSSSQPDPATPLVPIPRRMSRRRTNALKRSSAMSSKEALYTIVAVQDSVVMRWKHEDMQALLAKSPDLRGAMTRAMTAAIVGKVINFTVSRRASKHGGQPQPQPHWSNWLRDWTPTNDGARVQVQKDVAAIASAVEDQQDNHNKDVESPPGGPVKKFGSF